MDKNSISSKESNSPDSNVTSKLRRLKVQEQILIQSLKQLQVDSSTSYADDVDFVNFTKKLKYSYCKLINIFEDMKAKTCANEMLKSLDIEEIQNNLLELETNIKLFKRDLQSEIKSLKIIEEDITKQVNCDMSEINKRSKIQTVKYNKIVQSPVRVMISSPLKCLEVQQFQDFLAQSPNRYGGWNEYNHNIFKKLWDKYFQSLDNDDVDNNVIQTDKFSTFVEESLKNIYGVTKDCIIAHSGWFVQYLNLQNRRQKAIDKWKNNRKALTTSKSLMKSNFTNDETASTHKDSKRYRNVSSCKYKRELIKSSLEEVLCNKDNMNSRNDGSTISQLYSRNSRYQRKIISSTYKKSTKQWIYRRSDVEDPPCSFTSIENIKKVRIPNWRLGLERR
ncbi:hypothetical protein K1T71_010269 [Dendrolimus kikuchii]|uniref:Uncharacterized protein n=1 Tax=Dendrolimus kikuchii TaxID=765133 RepID=A0ACC1CR25_9NEOP|nr:hypothetical protein K1T71_010269 [Dendrolimus kikuchii]